MQKNAHFARKETLILKGKSMFVFIFRAKCEENFELLRISKGKSIAFLRAKRAENFGVFKGKLWFLVRFSREARRKFRGFSRAK